MARLEDVWDITTRGGWAELHAALRAQESQPAAKAEPRHAEALPGADVDVSRRRNPNLTPPSGSRPA